MATAKTDLGDTEGQQGPKMHPKKCRPCGSWIELKMINGCGPYAYRRWRENGHCRSKYIGKVDTQDEGT